MKTKELRTLKDLEQITYDDNLNGIYFNYIKVMEIKGEATKWIEADTKDLCEILNVPELDERDLFIIDLVLSKFNNLTEEDLK